MGAFKNAVQKFVNVLITGLAGTGTRYVKADANGNLSAGAIAAADVPATLNGTTFSGTILPSGNATLNLGSTSLYWAIAYINTISASSSNLTLTTNGGNINLSTSSGAISFLLQNGNSKMTIYSNGNMMLGNNMADSGNNFDVSGAARVQGLFTSSGTRTAASLIARGAYFLHTLVAAANNDVLVGLDIVSTFTNGAFTGTKNYALRVNGEINTTHGMISGVNTAKIDLNGAGGGIQLNYNTNHTLQLANGLYRLLLSATACHFVDVNKTVFSNNLILGSVNENSAVNTTNVALSVQSTTKTSHPFPSMTSAQRLALTMTAANDGDAVWQTDAGTNGKGLYIYNNGTGWQKVTLT